MKRMWSVILAAALLAVLTGCTMLASESVKLRDLEFTVLGEEKIPEELKSIIDEKKKEAFKLTYTDKDYLYICIGYGEQSAGGYSIAVNELYLTDTSVCVNTELLGPDGTAQGAQAPSCPYIVIKTEYLEEPVVFE